MPCDYSKYPKNWKKEIRTRILERDSHCCVQCGAENYAFGYHGKDGIKFYDVVSVINLLEDTGKDLFGEGEALDHIPINQHPVKIILTVAHLDHDITNNEDSNLKSLCQRHHLAHNKEQHQKNSRKTRENKKHLLQIPFSD